MLESALLRHIYEANPSLSDVVVIPPGDDMGGVRLWGNVLLAGVDQLVDGVHFRLPTTPIDLIGRKAITRCLSDLAAMAAFPIAALVAATLPRNFHESKANALFDAMRSTCDRYRCPLIGGDIAVHTSDDFPLVISTTVMGAPLGRTAATRSGARAGDGVYVTGPLGGSLQSDGLGHHLTFEPRIDLARKIHEALGEDRLHAMIDISDGLGRDACHIAELSGVQIILDADSIPCNQGCSWKDALRDGEDYELLFCAPGDIQNHIGDVEIVRIGQVHAAGTYGASRVLVRDGMSLLPVDDQGWDHG